MFRLHEISVHGSGIVPPVLLGVEGREGRWHRARRASISERSSGAVTLRHEYSPPSGSNKRLRCLVLSPSLLMDNMAGKNDRLRMALGCGYICRSRKW